MIDKEKEILIMEIVNRAEELGLMQTDRFTAFSNRFVPRFAGRK